MVKRSRAVAGGRSDKLKAKWNDTTKGADGLTYRERQSKRQSERMKSVNALARGAPAAVQAPPPPANDQPPNGDRGQTVVVGGSSTPPAENQPAGSTEPPAPVSAQPVAPPAPKRIGHVFR